VSREIVDDDVDFQLGCDRLVNLPQEAHEVGAAVLTLALSDHLPVGDVRGTPTSRNGTGTKTLKTDYGPMEIEVPRDRDGSFDLQLVKKRQTRFTGFDEKILGM